MAQCTNAEKLREVENEVMRRHRIYRRLIRSGAISEKNAARQIAIMTDIANDYREKVIAGPLFNQVGI